ncbi:MAG: PAS domain-containing sensor histidine kinase [Flavobacteriales bacterium]
MDLKSTIKDNVEFSMDFRIIKNDKILWLCTRVIPIYNDDGVVHRLIGITDDITLRKEKEIRISKLNELQDDVIKMLAHDLRSPISGVKFLAELISTKDTISEAKKHSIKIVESCDDTLKLMDDLLSHIQVGNDGLVLKRSNFIVEEQIRFAFNLFEDRIELKGLNVELPCSQTIIFADQLRFLQIMTNLISNAIKFNNKNGLVSVSVSQEDNQVLILVKDSGIGIPKEMQQEVFESFTNYGRAGSFGEKSTGLGLSITKRLVALHNGELSIVSEQTTGTTMKVRLPNLKINSLPV